VFYRAKQNWVTAMTPQPIGIEFVVKRVLLAATVTITLVAMSSVAAAWPDTQTAEPPPASAICIAIVLPSVQGVDGSATDFGNSLRELFMSYLTGPSLRAIALEARLASQAIEEARQKECGYVLMTTVTRKRDDGSGLGRVLGQAAGTAAWHAVPYGGGAGAAAARGAAIAGGQAISTMAAATRAKDELRLDYRFGPLDTAARSSPKSDKLKARSDGEDLLTPLVERASEAIAGTVLKK
jgi:hypothetical protein